MNPNTAGVIAALAVVLLAVVAYGALRNTRAHSVRARVTSGQQQQRYSNKLMSWSAAVVAITILIVWLGVGSALVATACAYAALIFWRKRRQSRETARFERDLPVALDAVARSMRSGAGVLIAFEEAGRDLNGPVAVDFAHVGQQVRLGRDFGEALDVWSASRSLQSVRLTVASMKLAMKTGAAQAEVVDRVALSVRQQLNAIASAKTHATQARASAWALTLLPIGFTGPMLVVDAATRNFLLHTWIGIAVLIIGLALDGLGALWMSRLVKRAIA